MPRARECASIAAPLAALEQWLIRQRRVAHGSARERQRQMQRGGQLRSRAHPAPAREHHCSRAEAERGPEWLRRGWGAGGDEAAGSRHEHEAHRCSRTGTRTLDPHSGPARARAPTLPDAEAEAEAEADADALETRRGAAPVPPPTRAPTALECATPRSHSLARARAIAIASRGSRTRVLQSLASSTPVRRPRRRPQASEAKR